MKNRSINLDEIITQQIKNKNFKLIFDENRFYLHVARLISSLRTQLGISQSELAKRADISQPMVARLERGDISRTPTFETIYKILKALGYSMSISIQKEKSRKAA